jgi:hypothetical protein
VPALEVCENVGPRRLTAGEVRARKACRLVIRVAELSAVGSRERGLKNRRPDRGVTDGGFRALRPLDAMDGGEKAVKEG